MVDGRVAAYGQWWHGSGQWWTNDNGTKRGGRLVASRRKNRYLSYITNSALYYDESMVVVVSRRETLF
jgi:hypothetical protein